MITLRKMCSTSHNLCQAVNLYEESFPQDERRPTRQWLHFNNSLKPFDIYEVLAEQEFLGIISVWLFDDFAYVEHFAIKAQNRGKGWGSSVIKSLRNRITCPIVIEVEPPADNVSRKRISFYERNGFHISNKKYLQPPYASGLKFIELKIMSTDAQFLSEKFSYIVDTLYRLVYNMANS